MSTTVEVDDRLQGNGRRNILLRLCGLELLRGGVVAVDIGLVVVLVMQLHDFAGNSGLESAIVVLGQD